MDELYFLGMDVVEETKALTDFAMITCTEGMTDNELSAYKCGVANAISALKTTLEDSDLIILNVKGLDIPTELSIDEVEKYYSCSR